MKIGAIGYYPFKGMQSQHSNVSKKAEDSLPVPLLPSDKTSIYSSSYSKNFFVANSPLSFKGIECSPGKFKIKTAYGVECPCCGQVMLTRKQSNAFVARVSDKTGAELQKELEKESSYFRKNEQLISDILIEASKQNPDYTLSQLVALEAKECIAQLEGQQKNIIAQMRALSEKLTPKKRERLSKILDAEENLIDNSDDYIHFKRKNFVDKIEYFRSHCGQRDSATAEEIFNLAQTMPTSATSKDAFFVKYQRRTNEDIARRLVLPAMVTTEHIRPQSKDGKNSTDNYIPLCGDCNSKRGNVPYNEWFKIHPEMPQNLQEYIYQISDLIENKGFDGWEFYDTYVDDVIEAVYRETNGALKLKRPEEAQIEEEQQEEEIQQKPKTIEEQREIWMSAYESLTNRLDDLRKLKDELYSDSRFLLILKHLDVKAELNGAKSKLNLAQDAFTSAKAAKSRDARNYKKAKKQNKPESTLAELDEKQKASHQRFLDERSKYNDALAQYNEVEARFEASKEGIVFPSEVSAKINRLRDHRAREEARQYEYKMPADIDSATSTIHSCTQVLNNLIAQIQEKESQKGELKKAIPEESSPEFISVSEQYATLKEKLSLLDNFDAANFNKFLSGNDKNADCSFIIEEAKASLDKKMQTLLENPIAQYLKISDDIQILDKSVKAVNWKKTKLMNLQTIDSSIARQQKRKAEAQRLFSNVDIAETIERLQKEADENLQKFTDSFENFGGYQHSNPNVDTGSSS